MPHVIVIGAGVTGVTTAYELSQMGFEVTVLDKHLYPAMETSFANGGQLSACNAEVWNQRATILKGLKWMTKKDAPLLINPSFDLHKYAWLMEFMGNIKHYEKNTIDTVKLALLARERMFQVAEKEGIDFNLEKKGILHFYHSAEDFKVAGDVNDLLRKGGLKRYEVTSDEMKKIEPTLQGDYYAGFYTEDDATGDIHKFSTGLAEASKKYGVKYRFGTEVTAVVNHERSVTVKYTCSAEDVKGNVSEIHEIHADAVVVCGGVASYHLANAMGDRVSIYPVKGYSITVALDDEQSQNNAPWVSLLDESAKIVTSRLGKNRFRVAGTAEFNGYNRDIRADRIQPLIDWVNKNFEVSTESAVPWSGLRPMMPDMMPKVKRSRHPRVFYNTGHGHLGFTLSAATAVMISEEIQQMIVADQKQYKVA
ncbi:D-amino acid dehydrogenase [Acinetobacter rathckeae]|uniref:D-amino acid dehydrogenase n=1 Tax=Acinetobacter rathckeae TaxID=2605272 RepID=UPI0018A3085F|nr:D-amino acid dehydrogenase [Acinetobacter rathckeae]MBF7688648.1 D-amino acid dehydrogenase [Acinetobacter rathckeae]MBF7695894.1 D-amino acid dehydrogenase [Acinetobacter rathckeae]